MTAEDIVTQYGHRCIGPFLQQYGRFFIPQPLPRSYRRGTFRACFDNSYRMVRRHPVTYVEGLAFSGNVPVPVLHAWCVDADGLVLDRTWHKGVEYFGIPFRRDFLLRMFAAKEKNHGKGSFCGLLDDWRNHYPLINIYGDNPELWRAGDLVEDKAA